MNAVPSFSTALLLPVSMATGLGWVGSAWRMISWPGRGTHTFALLQQQIREGQEAGCMVNSKASQRTLQRCCLLRNCLPWKEQILMRTGYYIDNWKLY